MRKLLLVSLLMIAVLIGCGNGEENGKISESGTVETINITLSSQVSGTVFKININDGEPVIEGDTILIIDPEVYQIQLLQAEAQRKMSEAQYALLKEGARSEDIAQANEALT
jgi:HlyD family secretion protein